MRWLWLAAAGAVLSLGVGAVCTLAMPALTHDVASAGSLFAANGRIGPPAGAIAPPWAWREGLLVLSMITLAFLAARLRGERRAARDFPGALSDSLPGLLALVRRGGGFELWNENLATLAGSAGPTLCDRDIASLAIEADRELVRAKLDDAFRQGSIDMEFSLCAASGEIRTVRWSGRTLSRHGREYLFLTGLDTTEARSAQARLLESEQRFRAIFNSVDDGIIVHDVATTAFIDVNARICELFGYTREELLRLDLADLSADEAGVDLAEPFRQVAERGVSVFEWQCKAKDGRRFWVEMSLRGATFGAQHVLLSTARDITGRKQVAAQFARLAHYDQLTELPNRGVCVDTLDRCIARARRGERGLAVLYLDLDHFKDVNDTLGHPVGDRLLQAVAQRLRRSVRNSDTVARFGGDEFAVILDAGEPASGFAPAAERRLAAIGERLGAPGATSAAICVANTLLRALSEPFLIDGNVIRSGATIGISVWGGDETTAETMLSRADVALYQAKSERRGTWQVFNAAMETQVRARVTMAVELSDAIVSDQLTLLYQPQVDLQTGRIVGLEALARWRHPTRGLLSAGDFIPAAELNGLIAPLGQWVVREACRQIRLWIDTGVAAPLVAVNVSAMQFKLKHEFADDIAASLAEFDLPPCALELELTESVLMETSRAHNDVVSQLRARGHRISIDDFGSGYSSLDYLRRYPADRIKLDSNFIADIGRVPGADALVKVAFELGRALDVEVVAEGVETEAQVRVLRSFGAQIAQGYYFARPLPAEETTRLLLAMGMMAGGAGFEAHRGVMQ